MIKCYIWALKGAAFCMIHVLNRTALLPHTVNGKKSAATSITCVRSEQIVLQWSCKELFWKGANIAINILYGITPLVDYSKPHLAHLIKLEWVFPQLLSLFSSNVTVTTKKEKLQHRTHSLRIAQIFPKKSIMRNFNNLRVILILQSNQCHTTFNALLHVALWELTQPDFLTSTLITIFLKCLLTSEINDIFYIGHFFGKCGQKDHLVTNKTGFYGDKSQDFLSIFFYIVRTKKTQPKLEVWAFKWSQKLRLALTDSCLKTSWNLPAEPEPGAAALGAPCGSAEWFPKLISHVLCPIPKISGADDDRGYFGGVTQLEMRN